jgi:hypothetical protein
MDRLLRTYALFKPAPNEDATLSARRRSMRQDTSAIMDFVELPSAGTSLAMLESMLSYSINTLEFFKGGSSDAALTVFQQCVGGCWNYRGRQGQGRQGSRHIGVKLARAIPLESISPGITRGNVFSWSVMRSMSLPPFRVTSP